MPTIATKYRIEIDATEYLLLVSIPNAVTRATRTSVMKSTKVQVVFYGALLRVFAPPRAAVTLRRV